MTYILNTNNSKKLLIIVEKTKICFELYVLDVINKTAKNINRKIHILYKINLHFIFFIISFLKAN